MKRTTITLTEELAARLGRDAHQKRTSSSEIVRRALEQYFGLTNGKREIPFAGIARSREPIDASKVHEMLAESWADDIQKSMEG